MTPPNVSPLPWRIIETPDNGGYAHPEAKSTRTIEAADLYDVAVTIGDCVPQEQANAAFIVRAVNNHERLVEALERTVDWLASYPGGGATNVYDKARAALAAAKEG